MILQKDEPEKPNPTYLSDLTLAQLHKLANQLALLESSDERLAKALRAWCQHQTYPALRLLNEHEDRVEFYEKMNYQLKKAFRKTRNFQ